MIIITILLLTILILFLLLLLLLLLIIIITLGKAGRWRRKQPPCLDLPETKMAGPGVQLSLSKDPQAPEFNHSIFKFACV